MDSGHSNSVVDTSLPPSLPPLTPSTPQGLDIDLLAAPTTRRVNQNDDSEQNVRALSHMQLSCLPLSLLDTTSATVFCLPLLVSLPLPPASASASASASSPSFPIKCPGRCVRLLLSGHRVSANNFAAAAPCSVQLHGGVRRSVLAALCGHGHILVWSLCEVLGLVHGIPACCG